MTEAIIQKRDLFENVKSLKEYSEFYEKSFLQYIGSKRKLMPFIVKHITGNVIIDLMAGTHSLGYYFKDKKRVYANDIMLYSFLIGKGIIESSILKLKPLVIESSKKHNFFENNYSGTYFTLKQCQQLDSLKYSIERLGDDYLKACYYSCLFNILDRIATTAGHFDGFLKQNTKKAQNRKSKDVIKYFEAEVIKFRNKKNVFGSKVYNLEALDFLKLIDDADTIYIDPPYNHRQYNTLYHIPEMFAKYSGKLKDCMYKYPEERYFSPYCYKSQAMKAFDVLLSELIKKSNHIVFSYSNKGLVPIEDLINLFKNYFNEIDIDKISYYHRKQKTSKGNGIVLEYIFSLSN